MTSLFFIPARGGSKRIPGKNIRTFCDIPIIGYPILAAKKSGLFSEIMVSTDSLEIARVAESFGASIPFLRSEEQASDYATTSDVIEEVLVQFESKLGKSFDYVCCCYATAPFVTAEKLNKAYTMLRESKADCVVPVTPADKPIFRALKLEQDDNKLQFIWPEFEMTRSQDLTPAHFDSGQFYFFKSASFRKNQRLFSDNTLGMEIPSSECQDIDTEEDWRLAEFKFKLWPNRPNNRSNHDRKH